MKTVVSHRRHAYWVVTTLFTSSRLCPKNSALQWCANAVVKELKGEADTPSLDWTRRAGFFNQSIKVFFIVA